MADTPQHGQPRQKPGGRAGAQPDKAAALQRLRRLKQGTTAATVLGFGAMSWLVFPLTHSTHTTAAAAAQPTHIAPTATATATSTVTPSGGKAKTAAAPSVNRARAPREATAVIHQAAAATTHTTKAAVPATKALATATKAAPTATAMPPTATVVPATATSVPATATSQSGFLTQGGQSNVGSTSSSQAPVASSGAS